MNDNAKSLSALLKVFDTSKIVSPEDITAVLSGIVQLLKNFKQQNESLNAETKTSVESILTQISTQQDALKAEVDKQVASVKSELKTQLKETLDEAKGLLEEAKAAMPEDGQDADPADVVPLVLEQIKLPENRQFVLTGEDIINNLNSLPTDSEDFKIDASRIKGLPRQFTFFGGGGSPRNMSVYDETTLLTKITRALKFVGAGVQATTDINGVVTVTIIGSASSESNGETLTDSGDHQNFTFAHAPTTGGVRNVWIKETGQLLTPTADYSVSGSTLTTTAVQVDGNGTPYTLISNYTF